MSNDVIDKYLTENQDEEVLLRLATVDRLIELYKDRTLVNTDDFCKSFDQIYNLIKDGKLPEKVELSKYLAEANNKSRTK